MAKFNYQNFTKSCLESENKNDLIADNKVCIRFDAQNPPQLFGAKGVYLQNIEMSNVQIITIEKQTISISMYLRIEWTDWRVKMNPLSQSIYLSQKDQKRLWSPQILIGNNMVSQNKAACWFSSANVIEIVRCFLNIVSKIRQIYMISAFGD